MGKPNDKPHLAYLQQQQQQNQQLQFNGMADDNFIIARGEDSKDIKPLTANSTQESSSNMTESQPSAAIKTEVSPTSQHEQSGDTADTEIKKSPSSGTEQEPPKVPVSSEGTPPPASSGSSSLITTAPTESISGQRAPLDHVQHLVDRMTTYKDRHQDAENRQLSRQNSVDQKSREDMNSLITKTEETKKGKKRSSSSKKKGAAAANNNIMPPMVPANASPVKHPMPSRVGHGMPPHHSYSLPPGGYMGHPPPQHMQPAPYPNPQRMPSRNMSYPYPGPMPPQQYPQYVSMQRMHPPRPQYASYPGEGGPGMVQYGFPQQHPPPQHHPNGPSFQDHPDSHQCSSSSSANTSTPSTSSANSLDPPDFSNELVSDDLLNLFESNHLPEIHLNDGELDSPDMTHVYDEPAHKDATPNKCPRWEGSSDASSVGSAGNMTHENVVWPPNYDQNDFLLELRHSEEATQNRKFAAAYRAEVPVECSSHHIPASNYNSGMSNGGGYQQQNSYPVHRQQQYPANYPRPAYAHPGPAGYHPSEHPSNGSSYPRGYPQPTNHNQMYVAPNSQYPIPANRGYPVQFPPGTNSQFYK